MGKHKNMVIGGGTTLFVVGFPGTLDDLSRWMEWGKMLNLPGWISWILVIIGAAFILYGWWSREEPTHGQDISEHTLLRLQEMKNERHKQLMEILDRNIYWVYMVLVFFLVWIIVPIVRNFAS